MKYFTMTWPNSGRQIWMFLYNVNIGQALLPRNTQNSENSMKYSTYWMTRFRDKLRVFILENIKTEKAILIKKIWDRIVLRNFQNSENFNLSNFTLTWSNEGKMNSVGSDMTCSKEIQEKNENVGQT